jgi:membrane protease YdiL (CAAX protease family)
MDTIRRIVTRYPLTAFFTLAFGVSWILWTPYVLGMQGLGVEPEFDFPKFLGTSQLLGVLPGAYLGPITAAFIVTLVADGREGIKHWARRLVRWGVNWKWYAAILIGVPGSIILATFALPGAAGNAKMIGATVAVMYIPMLVLQFVTTALAEEPGWRDFALPRLQDRFGATLGTVVLGLLWGCWHLPLFFTEWGGYPDATWLQPVVFIAACVPLSLVMTWVFNKTGQSLPIVMVLHASINATYSLVWPEVFPTLNSSKDTINAQLIAGTVVALVLIIATRGRLGLRRHDPEALPTPSPAPVGQHH